jgi:TolB protein
MLSPAIFAGIVLAFFLPFATVSCDASVTFTGAELATRQVPEPAADPAFDDEVEAEGWFLAAVALGAAFAGFVLGLARREGGGVAAAIGTAGLLGLCWQSAANFATVEVHSGFVLALLGYVALSLGHFVAWRRRRRALLGLPPRTWRWRIRVAGGMVAGVALVLIAAAALAREEEAADDGFVSFSTADLDPAWSPGGDEIAFGSTRGAGGIFVVRRDGSCLRRIGDGEEPAWSPDGRRLAVSRCDDGPCSVWVMARDGTRARVVARGGFWNPHWSADGSRLLLSHDEPDATTTTWVVGADGSGLRRLAPPWVERSDRRWSLAAASEMDATPSPDGSLVAFASSGDPTSDPFIEGIFVRSADGGPRRRLSDPAGSGDYEPAWSPDGRAIAFQRSGEIALMTAAGTEERVLTSVAGATDPAWSPDGRSIVFARELYGGSSFGSDPIALMVVDVASGETRRLTWGPRPVRPCGAAR